MLLLLCSLLQPAPPHADIVIYGGTSAGIAAAIQANRMGKSVLLIEPGNHLGGLTTGGLGFTDSGNKAVVGGIAREFYQRIKKHYDQPTAWRYGQHDRFPGYRPADDAMWVFEPSVAESILKQMLAETKVTTLMKERLLRTPRQGVIKKGASISSITMESGKTFTGSMFIDATYEGDLLAAAGVSFTVGREANSQYGEKLNGVARQYNRHNHRFIKKIDPYCKPGDPASGLLFGIEKDLPVDGQADHRLQAFCFRLCLSKDPGNRLPFPKPEGYDASRYELLFRNFEAGDLRFPMKIDMMPNGKTDINNNYAVSTDFIGQNYAYPDGSYAERDRIIKEHETYQKGLMWTLANHPRVPRMIREQMAPWGLPKDEFKQTGGWSHQIYVREARRMIGEYVHTEADCRRTRQTLRSVGMGSYNMDSHNCARYVTSEGFVQNEGDVQESPGGPYQISYLSLVPKATQCTNLLVPVCLSSTHIAYGSIRMEPVFMLLGQSAATAASLAIDENVSVQQVNHEKLQQRLLADKQVLDFKQPTAVKGLPARSLPGIVVDDRDAVQSGQWTSSTSTTPFIEQGYLHDHDADKGKKSIRFTPRLEKPGTYEVFLHYPAAGNRASNVPVLVRSDEGDKIIVVNQKRPIPQGLSLGSFRFSAGTAGWVEIRNDATDGHVVGDAVRWTPK